jgi:hypothetical protein
MNGYRWKTLCAEVRNVWSTTSELNIRYDSSILSETNVCVTQRRWEEPSRSTLPSECEGVRRRAPDPRDTRGKDIAVGVGEILTARRYVSWSMIMFSPVLSLFSPCITLLGHSLDVRPARYLLISKVSLSIFDKTNDNHLLIDEESTMNLFDWQFNWMKNAILLCCWYDCQSFYSLLSMNWNMHIKWTFEHHFIGISHHQLHDKRETNYYVMKIDFKKVIIICCILIVILRISVLFSHMHTVTISVLFF